MKRQFLFTDTTCMTAPASYERSGKSRGSQSHRSPVHRPCVFVEGAQRHIILINLSTPSVDRIRPPAYADSSCNATALRLAASNHAFRTLQLKLRENDLAITAHDQGESYVPLLR